MLRSTGFFRGIECPFYTDTSEGKGVRNGCNRPYCLFRHSNGSRSNGAPGHRGKRDVHSSRTEQGYDPFYPDVVSKHDNQNGEPSGDLSGELEMVNKAIEEVRSEMEREKRKLSRIGDQPYDPSQSALASVVDSTESMAAGSHLAYDPGSYEITTAGYNPAPGCSKYTLDSENQRHNLNSMEYVPTSVKKPSPQTSPHKLSSAPLSHKYSNSTQSSKSKYTLENSRPTTDMEYDPMSNYSARINLKNKRDVRTYPVKLKNEKTLKVSETELPDEEYVVAPKKPRLNSQPIKTFDSGESPGTEYQPSSLGNCQLRKNSGSIAETSGLERTELTESTANALTQRNKRDLDTQENLKPTDSGEKKTAENQTSHKSSDKHDKLHKSKEGVHKLSDNKMNSSSKESKTAKSSSKDSAKKENKSHMKGEHQKNTGKVKTSYEFHREGRDNRKNEDKVKMGEKNKTDQKKRGRDMENGARESKKNKEQSKDKDRSHKNGKLESGKRRKEKTFSRTSSSSSTLTNSKDIVKRSSNSSSNGKRLDHKRLSLSHADLFGDESPDESNPSMDCEDNVKEVPAGKSPQTMKEGWLNKGADSKLTQSSSEDEADDVVEHNVFSDDGDMFNTTFLDDDLEFKCDPIEECLRIFNESNDVKREDKGRQANQPSRNLDVKSTESTLTTLFPGQKRRVSHCVAKGNAETPQPLVQPPRRLSAQEVCYQRMQKAQQQAAQLTASVNAHKEGSKQGFSGGKKRIAYLPSSKTMSSETRPADAKPDASRVLFPSQNHQIVKSHTTAAILSKTSSTVNKKRVAHTPTMKSTSLKRPTIPSEFGAKVPTIIRQRYLNNFIDECVKFCPSEEAAFNTALDEEKLVYDRSSTKKIYLNIAVNTLKKLRSQGSSISLPASKSQGLVSKKKSQSHQDVLGGRLAATTSFTLNRRGKQNEEKLVGATLYRKLKSYLMTDEQLHEHGYPRVNPEAPGRAIINVTAKKAVLDPFTKVCSRCGAEYKININGNCVRREECSYHWGRLRPHKVAGGWERIYSCCSAGVGVPGCQISQQHVQDGRKESFDGYVSTFSKSLPADGNGGIFALDCEMCYTKQGLELTRVTVINSELKVVYDTFVKPDSKVIDYNTRFSGVTKEDLENTTINLRDVQAVLLNLFSAESILIGHSLESDLLALKLIHSTVVDTAIVFPHRLGLPYKRALKNLMADHLKRIIQDDVGGHDSSEDASACMELMIWKIKEDAKVKMSSPT